MSPAAASINAEILLDNMSASAKLISSKVIRSITNGGTPVSIELTKQTTVCSRPYCILAIKNEFATVLKVAIKSVHR